MKLRRRFRNRLILLKKKRLHVFSPFFFINGKRFIRFIRFLSMLRRFSLTILLRRLLQWKYCGPFTFFCVFILRSFSVSSFLKFLLLVFKKRRSLLRTKYRIFRSKFRFKCRRYSYRLLFLRHCIRKVGFTFCRFRYGSRRFFSVFQRRRLNISSFFRRRSLGAVVFRKFVITARLRKFLLKRRKRFLRLKLKKRKYLIKRRLASSIFVRRRARVSLLSRMFIRYRKAMLFVSRNRKFMRRYGYRFVRRRLFFYARRSRYVKVVRYLRRKKFLWSFVRFLVLKRLFGFQTNKRFFVIRFKKYENVLRSVLPFRINFHRYFLDVIKKRRRRDLSLSGFDFGSAGIGPLLPSRLRFRSVILPTVNVILTKFRKKYFQVLITDSSDNTIFTSYPAGLLKRLANLIGYGGTYKYANIIYDTKKRARRNYLMKVLILRNASNYLYKRFRKTPFRYNLVIRHVVRFMGDSAVAMFWRFLRNPKLVKRDNIAYLRRRLGKRYRKDFIPSRRLRRYRKRYHWLIFKRRKFIYRFLKLFCNYPFIGLLRAPHRSRFFRKLGKTNRIVYWSIYQSFKKFRFLFVNLLLRRFRFLRSFFVFIFERILRGLVPFSLAFFWCKNILFYFSSSLWCALFLFYSESRFKSVKPREFFIDTFVYIYPHLRKSFSRIRPFRRLPSRNWFALQKFMTGCESVIYNPLIIHGKRDKKPKKRRL